MVAILIFTMALVICKDLHFASACNLTRSDTSTDSYGGGGEPSSSTPQPPPTRCNHCTCPPKSIDELEQQYKDIFTSHCLSLSKINVPIDRFTWTPVHAITSSISCIHPLMYSSQCFQQTPQCSWSQRWIDLGEDFFPRFISSVECRASGSCRPASTPLTVYLDVTALRRQDRCDESGEVWQAETVVEQVGVACNCFVDTDP